MTSRLYSIATTGAVLTMPIFPILVLRTRLFIIYSPLHSKTTKVSQPNHWTGGYETAAFFLRNGTRIRP